MISFSFFLLIFFLPDVVCIKKPRSATLRGMNVLMQRKSKNLQGQLQILSPAEVTLIDAMFNFSDAKCAAYANFKFLTFTIVVIIIVTSFFYSCLRDGESRVASDRLIKTRFTLSLK